MSDKNGGKDDLHQQRVFTRVRHCSLVKAREKVVVLLSIGATTQRSPPFQHLRSGDNHDGAGQSVMQRSGILGEHETDVH